MTADRESSDERPRVYLSEFNVLMDGVAYLPLSSGLLQAHACSLPQVREHYRFMPFVFLRAPADELLARYERPALAAFSVSMWNEQLSLRLARALRDRFPECLIAFGGPQVPHHAEDYLREHPFVDVAVRGSGEQPFAELLERFTASRDFGDIPSLTWRALGGELVRNAIDAEVPRDLDTYASPYLEGLYEHLFEPAGDGFRHKGGLEYQAIVETNRGCPFPCTFCYWGQGGLARKYKFHSVERVQAEIDWFARHRIRYVFNADSNFGMHKRDMQVAQALVAARDRHGFPEKFRTCYGKNTDDQIFDIATYLHRQGMGKGITLSRQSNDEQVLINIRRQNIRMSTYENLQQRLNEADVPVYSELILGLPGESYASWKTGIEAMLRSGLRNQIFIFQCSVLTNTELAEPGYRARFGIETCRVELSEVHGLVRPPGLVPECEDIVVATAAMSRDEWKRMWLYSWFLMHLHGLKAGFFVLQYLVDRFGVDYSDLLDFVVREQMRPGRGALLREEAARYRANLERQLAGEQRCEVLPEFGNVYWEVEEASLLRMCDRLERYYAELHDVVSDFLEARGLDYDPAELAEALRYQRLRMPGLHASGPESHDFRFSFPEYFAARWSRAPRPLRCEPQRLRLAPTNFAGDRARYAREVLLWGRKSGTGLVPVEWMPLSEGVQPELPGIAAD